MEEMTRVRFMAWILVTAVGCSNGGTRREQPTGAAGAGGGAAAGAGGTTPSPDAAGTTPTGGAAGISAGGAAGTIAAGGDGGADAGATTPVDADAVNDVPAETATPGCAGLVCEDFESGAIDADKWTVVMGGGGTMMVQQQTVAHGKYALQVHGQSGPTDWAQLLVKSVPAALKGTATFGRVYFSITAPVTSGHTEMVFAGNTGTGAANGPDPFPKLRYMEVANIGGGWQLGFDLLDVAPLVEEVAYPKGQVPTAKWICLEWQFDDAPDHITMWTDGTQIGTFDDTDIGYSSPNPIPKPGTGIYEGKSTGIVGGFDTFGFGFHDWHPSKPFDLFYDDLVLGTTRVGCLP